MVYESEMAGAIGILIFVGVIIGFLILLFSYLSSFFNDYNTTKAEELKRRQEAEEKDKQILAQAKKHTLNYSEEYVKKIKSGNIDEDNFDIDFNINLKDSTVKTETVYAD